MRTMNVILIIGVALFCMLGGCSTERRCDRYIIPDGYTGWIKIYYSVKGEPLLPFKDGCNVIKISAKGECITSSNPEFGVAHDEFYYIKGDKLELLENGFKAGNGITYWPGIFDDGKATTYDNKGHITIIHQHPPMITYFIGTKEAFRTATSHNKSSN